MEDEIHDVLMNYADDAEVRVVKLDEKGISLSVFMPSRGDSVYQIRSANVIHIDMAMSMILGHIEFGGLSLLHPTYIQSRNFDYGGREEEYRVIHFVDVDDKHGFLVLFGREEIVTVTIAFDNARIYPDVDNDRNLPISMLPGDGRRHIHGRLEIRIAGRELPCLGGDDVCMDLWLVELHNAASALSAEDPAEYIYDEGEQGQPAFAFVRRKDLVLVSIRDSEVSEHSGGYGLPDWQEVECRLSDFVAAVQQLETEFSQLVLAASPAGGKR